jgi:Flp pilus assembly protein TadD
LVVFKRGIESYPQFGLVHAEYARALWMSNQRAESLSQMRQATELEPKNPMFFHGLAEILAGLGRGDEAAAADAKARALEAAAGGK